MKIKIIIYSNKIILFSLLYYFSKYFNKIKFRNVNIKSQMFKEYESK